MKKKLQLHLAEIFPLLPEEAIETLAKDIKDHGLHEPINLTDSQRAMFAAALAIREPGRPKADKPDMTQPEAAKAMQVSQASLKRALAVNKSVNKRGTPEIIEAVKSGRIKLYKAIKLVSGKRGGKLKEDDFYQPFADWLKKMKECTKAIVLGGGRFQDKWATPDVIGTSEPRLGDIIVAAEIKLDVSQSQLTPAFGQACAYRLFAYKSYLVIPANASEDANDRVHALCQMFGIGLVLFDDKDPRKPHFQISVRSQKHEPNKIYQNKYRKYYRKYIEGELRS